jgi:hypothetical protein
MCGKIFIPKDFFAEIRQQRRWMPVIAGQRSGINVPRFSGLLYSLCAEGPK